MITKLWLGRDHCSVAGKGHLGARLKFIPITRRAAPEAHLQLSFFSIIPPSNPNACCALMIIIRGREYENTQIGGSIPPSRSNVKLPYFISKEFHHRHSIWPAQCNFLNLLQTSSRSLYYVKFSGNLNHLNLRFDFITHTERLPFLDFSHLSP
jgi:hypothetical protein